MPRKPVIPNVLCYGLPDDIVNTPAMRRTITEYVMEREAYSALEAVEALHACMVLERKIRVPVSPATHNAFKQMESEMNALRKVLDARREAAQIATDSPALHGEADDTTTNEADIGKESD